MEEDAGGLQLASHSSAQMHTICYVILAVRFNSIRIHFLIQILNCIKDTIMLDQIAVSSTTHVESDSHQQIHHQWY
jgi:hypothetical protein